MRHYHIYDPDSPKRESLSQPLFRLTGRYLFGVLAAFFMFMGIGGVVAANSAGGVAGAVIFTLLTVGSCGWAWVSVGFRGPLFHADKDGVKLPYSGEVLGWDDLELNCGIGGLLVRARGAAVVPGYVVPNSIARGFLETVNFHRPQLIREMIGRLGGKRLLDAASDGKIISQTWTGTVGDEGFDIPPLLGPFATRRFTAYGRKGAGPKSGTKKPGGGTAR